MFAIQALLAKKVTEMLPTIGIIAAAVVLVFAFLVGFCKGYRRISRNNIYKIIAGCGFVFAYKYLYSKNLLEKVLKGKSEVLVSGLWAIALAVGCALVALLVYGAFNALFTPKTEYQKEYITVENGIEYDDEDFMEEPVVKKHKVKKLRYKPSLTGRLFGGLFCVLNFALGLAMLAAVAVVVLNCTKLATGSLNSLYSMDLLQKAMKVLLPYTFDVLSVGIIFGFGYLGYKNGFVGSIWLVLKWFGLIAVLALCFAAPFLGKVASIKLVEMLIEKMTGLVDGFAGKASKIVGKIAAGAVLAIAMTVVMLLVRLMFKSLANLIDDLPVFRTVDGVLATVVYALVGVLVCALVYAVLYGVGYCGWLDLSKLATDKPNLTQEMLDIMEKYLSKYADKYLSKLKK